MQEKYITDVAIDDIKKYQAKQKNNKKSSLRFPEKMKYNSCTKEMKLHVSVNKVLKRNNWPLRNNFLGQTKIVLVYKMYTHLVSHTGFIRNEQTDWCLLADTTFLTSVQSMYQNIFAYYSTTRTN